MPPPVASSLQNYYDVALSFGVDESMPDSLTDIAAVLTVIVAIIGVLVAVYYGEKPADSDGPINVLVENINDVQKIQRIIAKEKESETEQIEEISPSKISTYPVFSDQYTADLVAKIAKHKSPGDRLLVQLRKETEPEYERAEF